MIAGVAGLVALTIYLWSRLPEPAAHWPLWDVRVYQWAAVKVVSGAPLYARSAPFHFTYPPFAAALFGIAGEAPAICLKIAISIASACSLLVLSALSLGAAGVRRRRDRVLTVAALALLTVPVVLTFHLGETDLIVTALVAADVLRRRDGGRLQGVGVGLAAAIKLTPLIFVAYLLATRRTRAAAVAVGTFAITVSAGFLLLPADSRTFWLGGVFVRSRRVGGAIDLVDQSLAGMIARLAGGSGQDLDPPLRLGGAAARPPHRGCLAASFPLDQPGCGPHRARLLSPRGPPLDLGAVRTRQRPVGKRLCVVRRRIPHRHRAVPLARARSAVPAVPARKDRRHWGTL